MKKTSILTNTILAAVLTAGLQAYAITPTTTWADGSITSPAVTLGTPGHGAVDIYNNPYQGQISFSSLVVGGPPGTVPYSGQTLTGGTLAVEISDGGSNPIYAWVSANWGNYKSSVTGQETGNSSSTGVWLDFSLDSTELSYIEHNNPIDFTTVADCYLDAYYLTVTGPNSTVPDGGSTMFLLGGVLTTLGLIKRKMA